ncbi:MAG: tol-pal system protein YbgF [Deltaproteobacteria bacterium]|nr:tol-pal system protein YbgF [Deltaproteobacteria bacterium]
MPIKPRIYALMLVASVAMTACGPGFPIMTREQEALYQNIDRLVKEEALMKARMQAVESGNAEATQARKDSDSIRRSIAEAQAEVEKIRQEFAFVQGAMEEQGHKKTETTEAVKSLGNAIASINARLAAIENVVKDTEKNALAQRDASVANEKRASDMQGRLLAVDRRVDALENSVSAMLAEPSAKKAEPQKDPDALYASAHKLIIAKDYAEAVQELESFVSAYPNHKLAGNALYWLGEAHYARGEWEKAILEFDKVIKLHPKTEKAAGAMLKQGYAFEKLGSTKEASVLFKAVIERFPKTREAELARKRLKKK